MTITTTTISRLITYLNQQDEADGNHIVIGFFGIVTDDDDYNTTRGVNVDNEVIPFPPPLKVIALSFTNSARARIENAGGKCLSFHQLPFTFKKKFLFTFPKHHGTILIFKPNDIRSSSSSNQTTMRNVRRRIQGAFMDNLHDDLLCEILIRLPAKTLGGLKVINKRWYSFISDPSFVTKHTTSLLQTAARGVHSTFIVKSRGSLPTLLSFDCPSPNLFTETTFTLSLPPHNYDTPTIVSHPSFYASGGGLLIVQTGHITYIYNPLTKKYKYIPSPSQKFKCHYGIIFGGSTSSGQYDYNHYTLVCLAEVRTDFEFKIFMPNKWHWRDSNISSRINYGKNGSKRDFLCRDTLSVCYRGIIHWLTEKGYIVAFNLDKEEIRMIEIPKTVMVVEVDMAWWECTWIGVLEDEVILVVATSKNEIVTWVFHDYENNKWKIKRKDVINPGSLPLYNIRPLFFDGKRFLLNILTKISYEFGCYVNLRMEHDVRTGVSKPLPSEGNSSIAGSLLCVPITNTLTEV